MAECFDLFPKTNWATRPDSKHREATEQFKAAVMASRAGNDDSIKQVLFNLYFLHFLAFMVL